MTEGVGVLQYRPLRAPARDGEALIVPALSAAEGLVQQNVAAAHSCDYDCQGFPLRRLRDAARQEMLERARRHTAAYLNVEETFDANSAPCLLTGHQPQLFHPGVWLKSFALSSLGERLNAHAIHLIIDNDTADSVGVRVPRIEAGRARVDTILMDRPTDGAPFEEREILSQDLFRSFGERVREAIAPLSPDPLIIPLWPRAVEASRRGARLGQSVAESRHCLEAACGLKTLELPLSAICDGTPFRWFAAHLLAQLPRFHAIYNDSLAEYRRFNRVRSRSHPVPPLGVENEWLEAPFWLWTSDDPRRRRLFVRRLPEELELTDRAGLRLRLSLSEEGSGEAAVEQLGRLRRQNIKLRPRALLTTMFARLLLADLFLHGIGGAKYDQLTDLIIWRFFDLEPPPFLTLTATVRLPNQGVQVDESELRRVDDLLRELRFHPEKHAPLTEETRRLTSAKRHWIEELAPRGRGLRRHQEIERINQALQPFLSQQREQLVAERRRLAAAVRETSILASREYSFCLYSGETLPRLLLELLAEEP